MAVIAAIQTNSSDNIRGNLDRAAEFIAEAVESEPQSDSSKCELVVLPECFGFMQSSIGQLRSAAEADGRGMIQDFLAAAALKHNVWVIGGSVSMKTDDADKVTNSLLVYNSLGERIARYDKIFLFDVSLDSKESYKESGYTMPGSRFEVVDTPAGKIGLSICYDIRFPELYRELVNRGAEIFVIPSAFAYTTGKDHWHTLLKARAIENTCYVVAPAQFGNHNGKRTTWGHTAIIDPWGNTVAELQTGWGVVKSEIDLDLVTRIRSRLPSLQHCRPDIF